MDDAPERPIDMAEQMARFENRCRQAGLKLTPQRAAVYKALALSREHPSAEIVFQAVRPSHPSISLDTVNRTLATLAQIGAAFVVEGTGEPKRFDADLDHHQHFRCVRCRRIVDFHDQGLDEVPQPRSLGKGFTVLRKTVYFEGVCDRCDRQDD